MTLPGASLALSALLALAAPDVLVAAARSSQPTVTKLRITVLEGEGAVNIIQQRTAVAPVVEVRDQNGLPVPGVPVVFRIASGGATFPGGGTLSVTTNVAGRAVAAGLTPGAPGAVKISATAAFQGQTAAVTISQSNFVTAAAAATAAGGGGLSATTLAIIGGAIAGGAAVAVGAKSNDASPTGSVTSTPPPPATTTTISPTPPTTTTPPPGTPPPQDAPVTAVYNGKFSGTYISRVTGDDGSACSATFSVSGSVSVSAELRGDTVTGNFLEMVLQFQRSANCLDMVGPITRIPGSSINVGGPALRSAGEPFAVETNGPVSGGASLRFAQDKTEAETTTGGSHNVTVNTSLRRVIDITGQLTKDGGSATLSITHRTDMSWDVDPGRSITDGSGRYSFALARIR